MPKHQLGELLDEAKAKGLSLRDIEELAHGKLRASTMSAWRTADTVNLQTESILALATAIKVPAVIVFLASIGQLHKSQRRDKAQKETLDAFARVLQICEEQTAAIEALKGLVQERLSIET